METEAERRRREQYLEEVNNFRANAFKIIEQMVDWANQKQGSRYLVDEILHSIFFLGRINDPQFSPELILTDKDIYSAVSESYPQPFRCFSSELPRRSPFSCVLDMVVMLKGEEKENAIRDCLQEFVRSLAPGYLVSSIICICQNTKTGAARQYGVSMSTTGKVQPQIMIAASCFSSWEEYVAGAVMTYYPQKQKKRYFDGTFKTPDYVRCQAFRIPTKEEIPPCKSCSNMFGLPNPGNVEWAYGNCAENESLSNLLKNDPEVKSQSAPTSNTYTPVNKTKAKQSIQNYLNDLLAQKSFQWNNTYYDPQRVWQ